MSHVHLIVLQHGLWGSPADVENLTEYLREALQKQGQSAEELALLASGVNARRLTYDGIDVCGSRLAQLVQDTIQQYAEQGKQVTKLSLIGEWQELPLRCLHTLYTATLPQQSLVVPHPRAHVGSINYLHACTPLINSQL